MSKRIAIVRQKQRREREEEQRPRQRTALTEEQKAQLNRQRFEERETERLLYGGRNIPASTILKAEVLNDN